MFRLKNAVLHRLTRDEDGAALIQSTMLLAILVTAILGAVGFADAWMLGHWTELNAVLRGDVHLGIPMPR